LSAGSFSGAPSTRCKACKKEGAATGSVNRVASGGVINVENFDAAIAAQDNFAPDRIRDLRLTAAKFGTDFVTVSWTAPGDDVTYGIVSGYEISIWYETFANNTGNDVLLPESQISYNGTLLVEAGETLSITMTLGTLENSLFGLNDTVEIDTYFFRIRAYDDSDNRGAWSNELSASFVNPEDYLGGPVMVTVAPKEPNRLLIPLLVGISVCVVGLAAAIGIAVAVCLKKSKKVDQTPAPYGQNPYNQGPYSGRLVRTVTPPPPQSVIIE